MRKNINVFPPRHVQDSAVRQEFETGARKAIASFPFQHGIQAGAKGMEMQNIRRRIGQLVRT